MERIETKLSRSWILRMVIVGVAFLLFGLWSLYDGKIRYPEVNRDFRGFLADHAGVSPADLKTVYSPREARELEHMRQKLAGVTERWNTYWKQERRGWLARRGWKDMDQSKLFVRERVKTDAGIPGHVFLKASIYSKSDLTTQLLMAWVCMPLGLFILFRVFRAASKSAWADDSVFHSLKDKDIPLGCITGFDKKKWDRKSIAYVLYEADGKAGKAVLDEWIFNGSAAILEHLEQAVDPSSETLEGSVAEGKPSENSLQE